MFMCVNAYKQSRGKIITYQLAVSVSQSSLSVRRVMVWVEYEGGGGRSGEGVKMSSIAVFVFSHKGDLIRIMGKITNIALRLLHAII